MLIKKRSKSINLRINLVFIVFIFLIKIFKKKKKLFYIKNIYLIKTQI